MKKITLIVCAFVMGIATFAQTSLPCPSSFKRSNGAGGGCSIGKLTLNYSACPPLAPVIDSVYISGAKSDVTFDAGIVDCSGSQKVITYCILTSNIPPANTLTIYFHGSGAFNGTTCTVPPSSGPTPILLSSFVASRNGKNVNLKWVTASEINAKEFILQKKSGNDFIDFAIIPATNKSNGSSYNYVDNNISKEITEYRIKMVDQDNSYKNSSIQIIKGLAGATDFNVFPNPSLGAATIVLSEIFETASIQLIDNEGRIIKNEKMQNSISTSFRNLTPGLYLIRVSNPTSGETVTKKLTVIK